MRPLAGLRRADGRERCRGRRRERGGAGRGRRPTCATAARASSWTCQLEPLATLAGAVPRGARSSGTGTTIRDGRDRAGQPARGDGSARRRRCDWRAAPRSPAGAQARRRVQLDGATLWVATGWTARRAGGRGVGGDAVIDPATLQVLASALRGVAEEMGAALIRAAHSANIKERRDCSTACSTGRADDRAGRAHPGASGRDAGRGRGVPRAGAAAGRGARCVNDPFTGGTHLPDITLVSVAGRPRPAGLARPPRGRRRDVAGQPAGGSTRELYQEGLVIPPVRLTDEVLRLMLANMRQPGAAAGRPARADRLPRASARERLAELARAARPERLLRQGMDELHDCAERRMRAAIGAPAGRHATAPRRDGGRRHRRRATSRSRSR